MFLVLTVVAVIFVILLILPATNRHNNSEPSREVASTPPISYEVLEHRPVYKNGKPASTGVRMDVVISSGASHADALALAKYFRQKYGHDFIDIEIWDSADNWSVGRLWDKYASEGNKKKADEINKVIEEHMLVKVFYNPVVTDTRIGDRMEGAAVK